MAKIGDVGALVELGVKPGDVVTHIYGAEGYPRYTYTIREVYPHGFSCEYGEESQAFFDLSCTFSFRLISRADAPTFWRDMTPKQKGALLLAKHEGRVIEYYAIDEKWYGHLKSWVFLDHIAYRVRPEPTRVDLISDGVKVGTVAITDGKVDHDSVDWVK